MKFWYYEDFIPGEIIELGTYHVEFNEIVEFATEFDPAPFHMSEEGGRNSLFGGLVASGWHSCAMAMRLLCAGLLLNSSCQAGLGIDKALWHHPVRAGDILRGKVIVASKRLLKSRPGVGLIKFQSEYFTNNPEPVMTLVHAALFATISDNGIDGGNSRTGKFA
jgi:acyl dehydratase